MTKQSFFPLSINNYALIFLIIVAAIIAGMGIYAYNSIEQARANIQANNHLAADEELEKAVSFLVNSVATVSSHVSSWDEVFQQLDNPAYYSYWREYRLLKADILPDYVESAELFGANGKVLAEQSGSMFPAHIDVTALTPQLDLREGSASLVVFVPVKRSGGNNEIEGYLGLRVPFIKTLVKLYHFRYINIDTLSVSVADSHKIPLSDASLVLDFGITSSPEADTMMKIVKTSVIQLAVIVGVLFLCFYFTGKIRDAELKSLQTKIEKSAYMMKLVNARPLYNVDKETLLVNMETFFDDENMKSISLQEKTIDIDIKLERNSFGRQQESFEADIAMGSIDIPKFNGVFIRAPSVTEAGSDVEVLSKFNEKIVAVKKGNVIGTSFHPELTQDVSMHKYFVNLVTQQANKQ